MGRHLMAYEPQKTRLIGKRYDHARRGVYRLYLTTGPDPRQLIFVGEDGPISYAGAVSGDFSDAQIIEATEHEPVRQKQRTLSDPELCPTKSLSVSRRGKS